MSLGHYADQLHQALLKELFGETFKLDDLSSMGGVMKTLTTAQETDKLRQAQGQAKALMRAIEVLKDVTTKLYRE